MEWYEAILSSDPAFQSGKCARGRVLIVEDDRSLQGPMTRTIQKMFPEIEVNWFFSADEAIAAMENSTFAQGCSFDLVIADIGLPGVKTGFDLWSYFEKNYPQIHFMFMSGIDTESFQKATLQKEHVPLLLSKPFTLDQCKVAINALL